MTSSAGPTRKKKESVPRRRRRGGGLRCPALRKVRGPRAPRQADRSAASTGSYVYGIVPTDVELDADARGVGDPPGRGQAGTARRDRRPGERGRHRTARSAPRDDLMAHERLLDAAAAEVPVLPLRFGAVMTDDGSGRRRAADPAPRRVPRGAEGAGGAGGVRRQGPLRRAGAPRGGAGGEPGGRPAARGDPSAQPEDATWDARIQLGELIEPVGRGQARRRHARRWSTPSLRWRRHRRARADPRAGRRAPGRPGGDRTGKTSSRRPWTSSPVSGRAGSTCACSVRWRHTTSSTTAQEQEGIDRWT